MTRRKLYRIRRKYNRERREYKAWVGVFATRLYLTHWSLEYWQECQRVTHLLRKAPDNWWIEPKP